MAERGTRQAPGRIARETDGDEDEEHLSERLPRKRLERALLVRRLTPHADGELEGEHADDQIDRRTRDEARTRQPFEPGRARDLLALDVWRSGRVTVCETSTLMRNYLPPHRQAETRSLRSGGLVGRQLGAVEDDEAVSTLAFAGAPSERDPG